VSTSEQFEFIVVVACRTKLQFWYIFFAKHHQAGQISKGMMMMAQVEDEKRQTDEIDVGILTNFIRTFDSIPNLSVSSLKHEASPKSPQPFILLDYLTLFQMFNPSFTTSSCDEQDDLVSSLDIRDLLGLRLVSRETKSWVDVVMSKHKGKAFTLYFDEKKGRSLDRFQEERKQKAEAGTIGIPFGSVDLTEVTTSSSFFSHPFIAQFLLEYGPKIHRIRNSIDYWRNRDAKVIPLEELAFYQSLPNLTTLSTFTPPGENVPQVKMPALRNLKLVSLLTVPMQDDNGYYYITSPRLVINVDFLLNCPNLRLLWLPSMDLYQYVKILTALGAYFATINASSSRKLTIFIKYPSFCDTELLEELEGVDLLLQELAASDGKILIDCMPITLLDEAVCHFCNQPGKLRSFGKCIRSLWGFSSSLYEVELPNMRKLEIDGNLLFEGMERKDDEGYYMMTVTSWPKLEEIDIFDIERMTPHAEDVSYMTKLLFGSGVRPSVKRFDLDMKLQLLSSDAALCLEKLPNLTQLMLEVGTANVESFRHLMRTLPTSCPKLGCLKIDAFYCSYRLSDMDFLGGEDGGLMNAPPPLLQLPGKL
jgi:hypothetical protein